MAKSTHVFPRTDFTFLPVIADIFRVSTVATGSFVTFAIFTVIQVSFPGMDVWTLFPQSTFTIVFEHTLFPVFGFRLYF